MTEADTVHVLKEMIHVSGSRKVNQLRKPIASIGILLLCTAGSVAAQEQPAATEARYDGSLGIVARNVGSGLV